MDTYTQSCIYLACSQGHISSPLSPWGLLHRKRQGPRIKMSGLVWEWRAETQGSQTCGQYRFQGQCRPRIQTPFMGLSTKVLPHIGSQSSRRGKRALLFTPNQAQLQETWYWLSSLSFLPSMVSLPPEDPLPWLPSPLELLLFLNLNSLGFIVAQAFLSPAPAGVFRGLMRWMADGGKLIFGEETWLWLGEGRVHVNSEGHLRKAVVRHRRAGTAL